MTVTNTRVAVRVRQPAEEHERDSAYRSTVVTDDEHGQLLVGKHVFAFDHIFSATASQEDVYTKSVLPLFNQFVQGHNATILAYGQTGSGKTYSMGTGQPTSLPSSEGIVPRFGRSLFAHLATLPDNSYQVHVSFLEIANDVLIDLLRDHHDPRVKLVIRKNAYGQLCWQGVSELVVGNEQDLLARLLQGTDARKTGVTDMNLSSSRSHAIFSVMLRQDQDQEHGTQTIISKFHFVDLAGSERLKKTHAVGERAKEGIAINSELLALGNVISALASESKNHVPYRDSKLTRLLQDSLGGNSHTIMLACVSGSKANLSETLNTLHYASRARQIKNHVHVLREMSETDRLRAEVSRLRHELSLAKGEHSDSHTTGTSSLYNCSGSSLNVPTTKGTFMHEQSVSNKETYDREVSHQISYPVMVPWTDPHKISGHIYSNSNTNSVENCFVMIHKELDSMKNMLKLMQSKSCAMPFAKDAGAQRDPHPETTPSTLTGQIDEDNTVMAWKDMIGQLEDSLGRQRQFLKRVESLSCQTRNGAATRLDTHPQHHSSHNKSRHSSSRSNSDKSEKKLEQLQATLRKERAEKSRLISKYKDEAKKARVTADKARRDIHRLKQLETSLADKQQKLTKCNQQVDYISKEIHARVAELQRASILIHTVLKKKTFDQSLLSKAAASVAVGICLLKQVPRPRQQRGRRRGTAKHDTWPTRDVNVAKRIIKSAMDIIVKKQLPIGHITLLEGERIRLECEQDHLLKKRKSTSGTEDCFELDAHIDFITAHIRYLDRQMDRLRSCTITSRTNEKLNTKTEDETSLLNALSMPQVALHIANLLLRSLTLEQSHGMLEELMADWITMKRENLVFESLLATADDTVSQLHINLAKTRWGTSKVENAFIGLIPETWTDNDGHMRLKELV